MIKGTIIELKTGRTPPGPNSNIHYQNMTQLTAYLEIFKHCNGAPPEGLQRIDYETEKGDARHRYVIDGVPIAGVTSVLRDPEQWMPDEHYLKQGTWAHQMTGSIDREEMSQEFYDKLPELAVYFAHTRAEGKLWQKWFTNYKKFIKDYGLENLTIQNEVTLASKKLRVAGTLDKVILEDKPLNGILLYIHEKGYKTFRLRPSNGITSQYQGYLQSFRKFQYVYEKTEALKREVKKSLNHVEVKS